MNEKNGRNSVIPPPGTAIRGELKRARTPSAQAYYGWIIVSSIIFVSGCSAHLSSSRAPNVKVSALTTLYVVQSETDSHGVQKLIEQALISMGRTATSGPRSAIPNGVDAIVTYQDQWQWDLGWYLLNLLIQFRDPKTNVMLASALSYRTSLERKPPELMTREVLDSILRQ